MPIPQFPQLELELPEPNDDAQSGAAAFLRKLKDDFGLSVPLGYERLRHAESRLNCAKRGRDQPAILPDHSQETAKLSLDWRSFSKSISSGSTMSIKEILEELPKLTPEERQYVREWLAADEFPETEALIAAVDEGFRSSQTGKGISIEEARELVRKCATRSA